MAMKIKSSPGDISVDVVIILICGLIAFATLYPFWYCIVQSFNEGLDARAGGIYFWPRKFTLENYYNVFSSGRIASAFAITITRTVIGTVASVLFQAMVAYGLSKRDLMFRKTYMIIGIVTMYFSGGLIPLYFLLQSLGLINNFLVFILPRLCAWFNILLFIANFRSIPDSLAESARIDGAGEFRILWKIIFPSSMAIIATIALFSGVWHWNEWFDSAVFTSSASLKTLQTILLEIIQYANNMEEMRRRMNVPDSAMTVEALRYTTMVVAILPITMIYPFLQRYFVKGMMIGAIKG